MRIQNQYKVSWSQDAPTFDSLPVAKILDYPLEKRDYRPFAQCILCVGAERLHLRMWAFEVSPMPGSALECVLYPYPDKPALAVRICFIHKEGDTVAVSLSPMDNGEEAPTLLVPKLQKLWKDGLELHAHNGEDLQGVYWGMTLSLPVSALTALGGAVSCAPGDAFPGNFYKICEDTRFAHQGSFAPARFGDRPYARESMGEFRVVAY